MKKKFYLFAATAAMLLAACSGDDATGVAENGQNAPQAITFDTYTAGTTRSGYAGVMSNATLKDDPTTKGGGFGVFATQSNNTPWTASLKPDFMWNQLVEYDEPSWKYEPLKYWPNETINDSQTPAATSAAKDYLSFFAYAPYVKATTTTGAVTSTAQADEDNAATPNPISNVGITALSKYDASGAPIVSYQIAYTPAYSVDLLWGVAPSGGFSYEKVDGTTKTINEGMPLMNMVKPNKDQKMKFLFKHALARLGMTIVAAVDQISPGGELDDNTKIYVNSITITDGATTKTIPTAGDLILKNTTANVALWDNLTIGDGIKLVVSDDRSNINPVLVGDGTTQTQAGVKTSETTVIKDSKYFMLIPTPGKDATLDVTIDYTVYTNDDNVENGYTTTNNVITKQVVLSSTTGTTTGFLNNKAYNLKLILGMTSVKLDAEVADWEVVSSTEVNLPRNND